MKKKQVSKRKPKAKDGMRREYEFDYRKSRPNRFAHMASNEPLVVMVDSDVAEIFTTPESVNQALRALISAIPNHRGVKSLNR